MSLNEILNAFGCTFTTDRVMTSCGRGTFVFLFYVMDSLLRETRCEKIAKGLSDYFGSLNCLIIKTNFIIETTLVVSYELIIFPA